MTVFPLFNEIYRDGMGTAAITLVRALRAQGVEVRPVHAWRDVKFAEYESECHPVFVEGNDRFSLEGDAIGRMARTVNALAKPGDCVITFCSPNWLCSIPWLDPEIRIVNAVHSINPSTLKLGRAYADRVSAFVCISKGVFDRFFAKLPARHRVKAVLIPNAVEDVPHPKTVYSKNGRLEIVYAGRIEATSKGCDKIPKILAELARRGVDAHCDLYGYFHNWESGWRKSVEAAGAEKLVEWKGEVSHSELAGIIPRYDVFLAPTNFEGFGLSVAESMMNGVPVVTSLIPGVTDWMVGDTGRCVPKSDIKAFADALEMLAKDPAMRESLGRAARKRITELASFEAHGRNYAKLFRDVSSRRDYADVKPHCELSHYVQPSFLKPWGPARLLPVWLKTRLRRFM